MNSHKTKSILIVFSGYLFWIILDTLYSIFYQPEKLTAILQTNSTKLIPGLVICAFLVFVQLKIINKYPSKTFLSVFLIFITALLFSITQAFVNALIYNYWMNDTSYLHGNYFRWSVINCFIVLLGLTGLLYVSYYRNLIMQQKEQIARTKALANEAQLLMLQYQINPHFLFNALNAIQSMIEKDKIRAKDMIADLSDFFRYTLSKNNQMSVPLKEELDAIQKYLAIQKERFADKLDIEYEIDKDSLELKIPFFIIHPLVENAIKYGFLTNDDVLRLLIKVTRNGQTLSILVKNTGRLVSSQQIKDKELISTKTGIDNIKKRLSLFYPDCSAFELFEKDQWVHALITITHQSMSV